MTLECVVNVSEGRRRSLLATLASAAGRTLLDLHHDADHHRSVFTLGGPGPEVEEGARRLTLEALSRIDLTSHGGAHPRFGVVDVVPFVPLGSARPLAPVADLAPAVAARERFVTWAEALGLPCRRYGPLDGGGVEALPELRRQLRGETDAGAAPGVTAVGARGVLVAYNLWLPGAELTLAAEIARRIRSPAVRALALPVTGAVQVSCNLIDPWRVGPLEVYRHVARLAADRGLGLQGELVGLLPRRVLEPIPRSEWQPLGLSDAHTIEARLEGRLESPTP